jgi:hypothetical protein
LFFLITGINRLRSVFSTGYIGNSKFSHDCQTNFTTVYSATAASYPLSDKAIVGVTWTRTDRKNTGNCGLQVQRQLALHNWRIFLPCSARQLAAKERIHHGFSILVVFRGGKISVWTLLRERCNFFYLTPNTVTGTVSIAVSIRAVDLDWITVRFKGLYGSGLKSTLTCAIEYLYVTGIQLKLTVPDYSLSVLKTVGCFSCFRTLVTNTVWDMSSFFMDSSELSPDFKTV